MACNDFQDFRSALGRAGEPRRVRAAVDPALEITELFERPIQSALPAAINTLAMCRRMSRALGVEETNARFPLQDAHCDATKKMPKEGFARVWPPVIGRTRLVKARVDVLWKDLEL